ncbi:hypothetical protein [Teichococcus aestuarii]
MRLSITITAPGAFLHRLALRVGAVAEHVELVEVLARRHVAQREGLPHHALRHRAQRLHALDHLAAEAALEQRGGQGGGADLLQLVAGLGAQGHGRFAFAQ